MGFNQYNLGQQLHASEASGSEEEDFNIFLCISLFQTQDTLGEDLFWTLGPLFEQTRLSTTRQCYIPNLKQLAQVYRRSWNFKIFLFLALAAILYIGAE